MDRGGKRRNRGGSLEKKMSGEEERRKCKESQKLPGEEEIGRL
jgi:hypothetical protein